MLRQVRAVPILQPAYAQRLVEAQRLARGSVEGGRHDHITVVGDGDEATVVVAT
jgi:hypothetical protein